MTGRKDNPGRPLDLLTEFLVEDILNTPDEEILAEFEEAGGDPEAHAAEMRAFLEESILTSNKAKMAAAKAGVAAARRLDVAQQRVEALAVGDPARLVLAGLVIEDVGAGPVGG